MDPSNEPQSVRALYEAAEDKRHALDSAFEATSPSYREALSAALDLYTRAREQMSAVSLFSPNEGAEDIATEDLPYLLLDFHVAELVQKTPNLSPDQRADVVASARDAYERFLALVDGYELVEPAHRATLERYRDDPEGFAVVAARDAAARRDAKIANFRAEKQLRDRLETLRRNPRYLDHGDDELVRKVHLASVAFSVHQALQALDSLNRELAVLAQAPRPLAGSIVDAPAASDARSRNRAQDDEAAAAGRLDQPLRSLQSLAGGPLLSTQGKPLQPFTLVGSRDERARGVFRPGHNLPTMSIDEYLDEERRRGNILQGGVEEKPVVDEDDFEAADRETYKAREWDEFTDNNPKGAGNTLNRG